jgi:hypothetical protein
VIIGHLGIAMAVRARWPRVPLAFLAVASVAPDVVDLALRALRVSVPAGVYSHSLPAAAALAVLCGAATALWQRSPAAGWMVVAMVLLHLPADYITGLKILWPGGPIVGLNLYTHPMADFVLEALIAFAGWCYLRARDRSSLWLRSWLTLAALIAMQAAMVTIGSVKPNCCKTGPASSNGHAHVGRLA